jgi:hypothetical protein
MCLSLSRQWSGPRNRTAPCWLTSHVLNGPVQHKVEQWVEPLQDSTGLEKPPGEEEKERRVVSTGPGDRSGLW